MSNFNTEQLKEFKETFSLFDRSGHGLVPLTALGDILRSCGQNPTEKEVAEQAASANVTEDQYGEPAITFDEFIRILGRPGGFESAGTLEEFVQGFQVFDKEGNGYISTGELRYILTNLGEKLTDAQVDQLLRGVEKDQEGNINYEEFVKKLMAG